MVQRVSGAEASSRAAKTALFDEFARLGQALANGRRLEILDVLANGERTVERLASETLMVNELYLALIYRPVLAAATGLAARVLSMRTMRACG